MPKSHAQVDAAPSEAPARRMPVSDETVVVTFTWKDVPWSATMRTGVASGQVDAMYAGPDVSIAEFKAALAALVTTWDFVDEKGDPLPLPADGGIKACPYALLLALARAYTRELEAPKG